MVVVWWCWCGGGVVVVVWWRVYMGAVDHKGWSGQAGTNTCVLHFACSGGLSAMRIPMVGCPVLGKGQNQTTTGETGEDRTNTQRGKTCAHSSTSHSNGAIGSSSRKCPSKGEYLALEEGSV